MRIRSALAAAASAAAVLSSVAVRGAGASVTQTTYLIEKFEVDGSWYDGQFTSEHTHDNSAGAAWLRNDPFISLRVLRSPEVTLPAAQSGVSLRAEAWIKYHMPMSTDQPVHCLDGASVAVFDAYGNNEYIHVPQSATVGYVAPFRPNRNNPLEEDNPQSVIIWRDGLQPVMGWCSNTLHGHWHHVEFSLDAYAGRSVAVAFLLGNDFEDAFEGGGLFVDDLRVFSEHVVPTTVPPLPDAPSCGDGICAGGESCSSCVGDCPGVSTGSLDAQWCCVGDRDGGTGYCLGGDDCGQSCAGPSYPGTPPEPRPHDEVDPLRPGGCMTCPSFLYPRTRVAGVRYFSFPHTTPENPSIWMYKAGSSYTGLDSLEEAERRVEMSGVQYVSTATHHASLTWNLATRDLTSVIEYAYDHSDTTLTQTSTATVTSTMLDNMPPSNFPMSYINAVEFVATSSYNSLFPDSHARVVVANRDIVFLQGSTVVHSQRLGSNIGVTSKDGQDRVSKTQWFLEDHYFNAGDYDKVRIDFDIAMMAPQGYYPGQYHSMVEVYFGYQDPCSSACT